MTTTKTILAALAGLLLSTLAACDPVNDPCMGLRPVIEQKCASGDAEMCIQLQQCTR